ncbi:hypothetical protein B0H19DRAFT_1058260 [Mycena capillaripes]|nr:hypothetical protein B0H19DRAFT_1058260 [Mycena capillaripes]
MYFAASYPRPPRHRRVSPRHRRVQHLLHCVKQDVYAVLQGHSLAVLHYYMRIRTKKFQSDSAGLFQAFNERSEAPWPTLDSDYFHEMLGQSNSGISGMFNILAERGKRGNTIGLWGFECRSAGGIIDGKKDSKELLRDPAQRRRPIGSS